MKGLSNSIREIDRNIGPSLEDIAHVVLPGYLERHLGIVIKEFRRKSPISRKARQERKVNTLK